MLQLTTDCRQQCLLSAMRANQSFFLCMTMQSIKQYIFARQLQPSYTTVDPEQGKETQQACIQGGREQHQTACMLWLRQHPHIHTSTLDVLSNHLNAISADQGSKGCVRHACALSVYTDISSAAKGLFHAVYGGDQLAALRWPCQFSWTGGCSIWSDPKLGAWVQDSS